MIKKNRQVLRITIATRKMRLNLLLIKKHMNRLKTMLSGARKLILSSIWNAPWILLTSVVILVTSPAVEYLSMSENEKRWILVYMASLRLAARPVEEYAAKRAAKMPNKVLKKAIRSIRAPYLYTSGIFPALIPLSIRDSK